MIKKKVVRETHSYLSNLFIFVIFIVFHYSATAQNYYRNWIVKNTSNKKYIALVVGNNHYTNNGNLTNPIPTAKKLEKELPRLGFDVLIGTDLDRQQMVNIIQNFAQKIKSYEVSMVFYMGHGFEIDGENYLIPIDANPQTKTDVKFQAINVDDILESIKYFDKPKIIVLDACRDNPFAKNWTSKDRGNNTSGFGNIMVPYNSEVFFSIQKGAKVRDDNPYISYFLDEMKKGNCLDDITRNVTRKIINYNSTQIPAKYGQLLNKVCFEFVNTNSIEDWVEKGDMFFGNYDYGQAFYWYEKAAKNGSISGQVALGYMYLRGYGMDKRDYKQARYWCGKAAEQGSPKGQAGVAEVYLHYKDYTNAYLFAKLAAMQGLSEGQMLLGYIYCEVDWSGKDCNKGIYWIEKAAEQQLPIAQTGLGNIFYRNKKYATAVKWYKKACENGDNDACEKIKEMKIQGKI